MIGIVRTFLLKSYIIPKCKNGWVWAQPRLISSCKCCLDVEEYCCSYTQVWPAPIKYENAITAELLSRRPLGCRTSGGQIIARVLMDTLVKVQRKMGAESLVQVRCLCT